MSKESTTRQKSYLYVMAVVKTIRIKYYFM